jgi:hypothetical protein
MLKKVKSYIYFTHQLSPNVKHHAWQIKTINICSKNGSQNSYQFQEVSYVPSTV